MTPREQIMHLADQIEALNAEIAKLEQRKKELVWQQNAEFKKLRDEIARKRVLLFGEVGIDD